jgi:hypothetical protein
MRSAPAPLDIFTGLKLNFFNDLARLPDELPKIVQTKIIRKRGNYPSKT